MSQPLTKQGQHIASKPVRICCQSPSWAWIEEVTLYIVTRMFIEILLCLVLILVILYKIYTWNYDYWEKKGIPYLKPEFPFGNLKDVILMRKTIGQAYTEMYWKFENEPFFGFFKLRNPILMLRDPELFQEVLVRQFSSFDSNDYYVEPEADPILGLNPFNCRGERWKQARGLITPCLTGLKIKGMLPQIMQIAKEMISYLKENEGEFIQTYDLAGKYTTDVVSGCAYGLRSNSFKDPNSEFRQMSAGLFSGSFKGNAAVLFSFYAPKLGSLLKWKILSEEATEYFERIIKEAADYRIKNNIQIDDLLQALINANLKSQETHNKPAYSYREMAGHCMTFSLDGFETGALLISFMMYELSMNEKVQSKLRKEILNKVNKIDEIDYETIHSIDYLNWSINECLRKHSPGTMLVKKCNKEAVLESNGKKVVVEPGVSAVIPLLTMMNDPSNFPEPEKFIPERFDGTRNHHPYSHIPFSGGPRSCPGRQFALTMVNLAIISIVANFKIVPKDLSLTKIEEDPMFTFFHHSKEPIFVSFEKLYFD